MKKTKKEIIKDIDDFFRNIKTKTPKEVKKIKKLAMKYKIPLKEKRKLFCKKCYSPFISPKIRIKKGLKIVECKSCGYVSRWKIK